MAAPRVADRHRRAGAALRRRLHGRAEHRAAGRGRGHHAHQVARDGAILAVALVEEKLADGHIARRRRLAYVEYVLHFVRFALALLRESPKLRQLFEASYV